MSTKNRVTINDLLFPGSEVLDGEVGIEVEVEGSNLPQGGLPFWNVTRDGSLRGESYEYVFRKPIKREKVAGAISQLYLALSKAKVEDSGRAGVHVHVNVRDLSVQELFCFISLYVVFENILVEMCGEERKGNLFCLRTDDAEFLLFKIKELFETLDFRVVRTDAIRYSSMNLTAITKYGSLEFRSLPSPVPEDTINLWVSLLLKLKDKAIEMKDPRLMVTQVSEYGGKDFAGGVFGDLLESIPCDDWNRKVFKGIRKIQPLVYGINFERVLLMSEKFEKKIETRATMPNEVTEFNIDGFQRFLMENGVAIRNPFLPPQSRN